MKNTPQKRAAEVDVLIDNKVFDNDKLVYSFVLGLRTNKEIDECIAYVQLLLGGENEEHQIYYKLWYLSLLYLRGDFEKAKHEFLLLPLNGIDGQIKEFYLKKLGFDELYDAFTIEETEHFIFHIHPKRYQNQEELRRKIDRRELGFELVGKGFFGLSLERKIHYFLWDDEDMKNYFPISQTCSCYGVIQESVVSGDWHESAHVYNYLYGLENPKTFILEGIAVVNDGRKSSFRLNFAQAAYQKLGIKPDICEWWKDAVAFRKTNSWITYTTAGYFVLKLLRKYGKEKLLRLSKYQTYEDACQIYGEEVLLAIIKETETEITQTENV